jgi:DNA polymerase-3 subunit gamma/tau
MLSTHAFNALLKTLEEPPAHVYFIFATTSPQKIPDTIKSRCQRHHFKRLENAEIASRLEEICKAEKVEYEMDGLRLLARKADGSMRDGTSLLDQCVTASGGNVTADAVRGILGLVDQEKVLAFVGAVASGDATRPLQLLDAAVNEGVDLQDLLAALLECYRDLMVLSVPGDLSSLLFRSQSEIDHLKKSRAHYELGDLVTVVERLCNAAGRLKTMSDPRVFFETVLVDLTLLDKQTDIRSLIARLDGPSSEGSSDVRGRAGGAAPGGAKASASEVPRGGGERVDPRAGAASLLATNDLGTNPRQPVPATPIVDTTAREDADSAPVSVAEGPFDLAKIQQLWDGFVTFVRQKKVSLGVCLISGKPYAFDGKRLLVRFMKSFSLQREQASRPESLEFVRTMFERYFGHAVEIVCFAEGEEKAMALDEAMQKKPPEERFHDIPEDKKPVMQRLIKEFDGEIVRYQT